MNVFLSRASNGCMIALAYNATHISSLYYTFFRSLFNEKILDILP